MMLDLINMAARRACLTAAAYHEGRASKLLDLWSRRLSQRRIDDAREAGVAAGEAIVSMRAWQRRAVAYGAPAGDSHG